MSDNRMDNLFYSIAEASERLGVTYRALHYYEQKLGVHVGRDGAGNRFYTEANMEMFEKIIELKTKGMSLDAIKSLFEEKGLLDVSESANLVVIDENTLAFKEFFMKEIQDVVSGEFKVQVSILMDEFKKYQEEVSLLKEQNEALRGEIQSILTRNDDHYKKVDEFISAWRTSSEPGEKKSFFKNIFRKK